jgi:hypothetical protein
VDTALIIGYGDRAAVTSTVFALRDILRSHDVAVGEMMRADGGRYWSYLCESVQCCPAEGTPYDVTRTEVAAAATYAGQVALPDRATLERSLAPVEGAEREAVERATERAAGDLAGGLDLAGDRRRAGSRALAQAVRRHADGGRLTDDELARLTLLLVHTDVRDLCWTGITVAGDRLPAHVDLWGDVTRRARADLVAAPATLLGYATWRGGNGAMAWIAVQRALEADPAYALARLLGEALDRALPPSLLDKQPARQRRRRRSRSRPEATGSTSEATGSRSEATGSTSEATGRRSESAG